MGCPSSTCCYLPNNQQMHLYMHTNSENCMNTKGLTAQTPRHIESIKVTNWMLKAYLILKQHRCATSHCYILYMCAHTNPWSWKLVIICLYITCIFEYLQVHRAAARDQYLVHLQKYLPEPVPFFRVSTTFTNLKFNKCSSILSYLNV